VRSLLGLPLATGAAIRRAAYDRGLLPVARLRGPVVSVGNLVVGGRGKTPVVQRLAEMLRAGGAPVAVLSRGYGGGFRGEALVVGDGERVLASAVAAGDEPLMLARSLPGVVVAVGPRRDRVGRAVESRFGPRVHLLDDGFQHLRLHRDLDIVCVAPADLQDHPLPGGRLRESVHALSRADIVLLGTDGSTDEELSSATATLGRDRVFRLRRVIAGFFARDGGPRPAPTRPFLLAAIAGPDRFEADARRSGSAPAGTAFFRDHHPFTSRDLADVAARARAKDADAIVTTAKDEVRLPDDFDPGLPLLVLRITAGITDEDRLRARLSELARRAA
jgi:tetraacyldisaccharide 4'-kinase